MSFVWRKQKVFASLNGVLIALGKLPSLIEYVESKMS
jgi:hypothetical protein